MLISSIVSELIVYFEPNAAISSANISWLLLLIGALNISTICGELVSPRLDGNLFAAQSEVIVLFCRISLNQI